MKKSSIIRRAKKLLMHPTKNIYGHSSYICDCIGKVGDFYNQSNKAYDLIDWIDDLLDGEWCLKGWLYENGVITYTFLSQDEDIKLQNTRLAWMDWMIEYWKARGD